MGWLLNHRWNTDPIRRPRFVPTRTDFAAVHGIQATPDWQRRYEEACKDLDFHELHDHRYVRKMYAAHNALLRSHELQAQRQAAEKAVPMSQRFQMGQIFEGPIEAARQKYGDLHLQYSIMTGDLELHKRRLEFNLTGNIPTLATIDAWAAADAARANAELERERQLGRPRKNSVTDVVEPIEERPGPDKWANYYALQALREREAERAALPSPVYPPLLPIRDRMRPIEPPPAPPPQPLPDDGADGDMRKRMRRMAGEGKLMHGAGFLDDLRNAFDPNKNGLNASVQHTKEAFDQSIAKTGEALGKAFDPNKNGLAGAVQHLSDQIKSVDWSAVKNQVGDALDPQKNGVTAAFEKFGGDTKSAFEDLGAKIRDSAQRDKASLDSAFAPLVHEFTDPNSALSQFVASAGIPLTPDQWKTKFEDPETYFTILSVLVTAAASVVTGGAATPEAIAATKALIAAARVITKAATGKPVGPDDIAGILTACIPEPGAEYPTTWLGAASSIGKQAIMAAAKNVVSSNAQDRLAQMGETLASVSVASEAPATVPPAPAPQTVPQGPQTVFPPLQGGSKRARASKSVDSSGLLERLVNQAPKKLRSLDLRHFI